MIHQSLEAGGHQWTKTNLVTQIRGDHFKCECGAEGWSKQLGVIALAEKHKKKAKKCPVHNKDHKAKEIRVTLCTASGPEFEGLTPQSVHKTVPCPEEHKGKNLTGVWVMGRTEPVRLLPAEFIVTKNHE